MVATWVIASLAIAACGDDAASEGSASAEGGGASESGASEGGASEGGASESGATNAEASASADGESESESADSGELPPDLECEDPQPILQTDSDVPTGFVQCSDGFVHRVEAATCVAPTPSDTCTPDPTNAGSPCETAADCTAQPYGSCAQQPDHMGGGCDCKYGCATDADCGDGEICMCAGLGGGPACIPASCVVDADCDGMCGWNATASHCGDAFYQMGCLDEAAECRTTCPDAPGCNDVIQPVECVVQDNAWVCQPTECGGCG